MSTELTDSLNYLFENYVKAKNNNFSNNEVGNYIRQNIPRLVLNKLISNIVFFDQSTYSLKARVGQGKWADVPWLGIFNEKITKSAQYGVYIVYLLSKDGNSIYLTLNQGSESYSNKNSKKDTYDYLKSIATLVHREINSRGFCSDDKISLGQNLSGRAEKYEKGTILYKQYKKNELPSESVLLNDLSDMLKIYEEYYEKIFNKKDSYPNPQESKSQDCKESTMFSTVFIDNNFDDPYIAKRYTKSLLAKGFVILTGNSGSGKTKLSKDLATLLGIPVETTDSESSILNKLIIPVGSDWTDNTKVLGFYNPMTHLFHPTKILNFILSAEKNPHIPFFLVLDEMNLSHVERYFSDFLSAMESGESIPLYERDEDCKETVIPESIKLPENLFVTGTVNIDETTYMFSPKVLDRANVIEFKPSKESVLGLLLGAGMPPVVEPLNDGSSEAFMKLANKIRSASVSSYNAIVISKVKDVLSKFYDVLQQAGFEFAYRTVNEISKYLMASYELKEGDFNLDEAMDEQIVQKILPKIHGNRKQISNLLTDLEKLCVIEVSNGESVSNAKSSKIFYNLSYAKIGEMKKKLENAQYASFI